jgi:myosin heavy subunit
MALPRQVEEQIREVEEIEKQLAAQANVETDPPAGDEPPAEPEVTKQPGAEQSKAEEQPKPVTTVDQEPEEKWEQRYRTLKGMYDAEVPRLHTQVKELSKQISELQKTVEKSTQKPVEVPQSLVTEDEIKTFGADLIEVQRKVAREVAMEFKGDVDKLRQENETLREQLTSTGAQVSEASFEQRLHRLVPDFDQVNADPRWVNWLEEVDPILRGPRKNIAQVAYNSGDAEAVAHYVSLFKSSVAAPAPQVEDPVKRELNNQIQPKRSSQSSAPTSKTGRIYSAGDIEGIFIRIAQMNARGQLEEARKLEAEIDAAYTEGRVTA